MRDTKSLLEIMRHRITQLNGMLDRDDDIILTDSFHQKFTVTVLELRNLAEEAEYLLMRDKRSGDAA